MYRMCTYSGVANRCQTRKVKPRVGKTLTGLGNRRVQNPKSKSQGSVTAIVGYGLGPGVLDLENALLWMVVVVVGGGGGGALLL